MKRLRNKVALVTGGAGAIGAAVATALAGEGALVVVADRRPEEAAAVAGVINSTGGQAVVSVGDIGDPDAAQAAVDTAVNTFGALHVLVNNAGVSPPPVSIEEMPVETFDEVVRINLRAAFLGLGAAARAMRDAGTGGAVVNIGSSMAGWDVLSGEAAYLATKHGVTGLTRSAALDLAPYGIRVNAVCPGVIQTKLGVPDLDENGDSAGLRRFANRIPLRRVGQPEDVAAVVVFLASDEARHVTGASWLIDGGQTLQSWANAPDTDAYPLSIPITEEGEIR